MKKFTLSVPSTPGVNILHGLPKVQEGPQLLPGVPVKRNVSPASNPSFKASTAGKPVLNTSGFNWIDTPSKLAAYNKNVTVNPAPYVEPQWLINGNNNKSTGDVAGGGGTLDQNNFMNQTQAAFDSGSTTPVKVGLAQGFSPGTLTPGFFNSNGDYVRPGVVNSVFGNSDATTTGTPEYGYAPATGGANNNPIPTNPAAQNVSSTNPNGLNSLGFSPA